MSDKQEQEVAAEPDRTPIEQRFAAETRLALADLDRRIAANRVRRTAINREIRHDLERRKVLVQMAKATQPRTRAKKAAGDA